MDMLGQVILNDMGSYRCGVGVREGKGEGAVSSESRQIPFS